MYDEGIWHLFFQHHPDSLDWGPMHWGHATSRDLTTWEPRPIALTPDSSGVIYSGSAVRDGDDTAGFGPDALVAIYTSDSPAGQDQCLAYSTDHGSSWVKYDGNPVLTAPPDSKDFRDPKVFWGPADCWVMVLAVGREAWLYTSADLKQWTRTDVIGGRGNTSGVWETPDLFEVDILGAGKSTWVLMVSVMEGAPAGGSGTQYFVGDFDGKRFHPAEPAEMTRWADCGGDFYAPQTWSGNDDGRRVAIAWMSNWSYGRDIPAAESRGVFTAPRELSMGQDGLTLTQALPAELTGRLTESFRLQPSTVEPGDNPLAGLAATTFLVRATFDLASSRSTAFGLRVRVGEDEATTLRYDVGSGTMQVDRSRSGRAGAVPGTVQRQRLDVKTDTFDLVVLVDTTSVEVFADGGRVVFTNLIFPDPHSAGLELFAEGGSVRLTELVVSTLEEL